MSHLLYRSDPESADCRLSLLCDDNGVDDLYQQPQPLHARPYALIPIVGNRGSASYAIKCGIKKTKFRKHTKNLSTHRELTWFGRLPTSTGKGGVFFASSQKEVHDTMLLDLFYSPRVHESL